MTALGLCVYVCVCYLLAFKHTLCVYENRNVAGSKEDELLYVIERKNGILCISIDARHSIFIVYKYIFYIDILN